MLDPLGEWVIDDTLVEPSKLLQLGQGCATAEVALRVAGFGLGNRFLFLDPGISVKMNDCTVLAASADFNLILSSLYHSLDLHFL